MSHFHYVDLPVIGPSKGCVAQRPECRPQSIRQVWYLDGGLKLPPAESKFPFSKYLSGGVTESLIVLLFGGKNQAVVSVPVVATCTFSLL